MLKVILAFVVLLVLARAIVAVVDVMGQAARSVVRVVLALCVEGFAVAAGALVSLAVGQYWDADLLGLGAGRWAR